MPISAAINHITARWFILNDDLNCVEFDTLCPHKIEPRIGVL